MRENVGWQDDSSGPEPVAIGVTHAPYRAFWTPPRRTALR